MTTQKQLFLAFMLTGLSFNSLALDLGEFEGMKFSVGGYVKAEGQFNMPDDGDRGFEGGARQTRLNLTVAKTIQSHKLKGFVETDFWDDNTESDSTYAPRIRHAYLQVDNLTIGQTWNGHFFATALFDVEMIDFWNPGYGSISANGAVVRPDLVVHYTHGGARFSLQDPVYTDADVPDMIASYTHRMPNGHAMNLAVFGREIETGTDDSKFGVGVSAAAKLKFDNITVGMTAYTGKGGGVYAGWGYNGARGTATADVNDNGDLISTTGFSIGATYKFSEQWRSTLRYGQVEADEVADTMTEDTIRMAHWNLIYTYLPNLEFGLEVRDQNAASRPPTSAGTSVRPAGQQVELMAKYQF